MSVLPLTILIIMSVFTGLFNLASSGMNYDLQRKLANQNDATQRDLAAQQIESTEKINQQNIDMQRETNALQVSESEKAYQRSRVDAQVAQFVAAGFSEQQARAIVAGAANPGAYTPATLTSPQADPSAVSSAFDNLSAGLQNGYQMRSDAISSMSSMVGSVGTIADSLFQSLSDPTGGSVGALVADDAIKELTTHLHELSPAYRSLYGLQQLADSPECPEWLKNFKDSDVWNRCINSLYGRKTLSEFFRQATSVSMDNYALDAAELANKVARIKVLREDFALQEDSLRVIRDQLQTDFDIRVQDSKVRQSLAMFDAQASEFERNASLYNNPQYRRAWLRRMMQDETNALLIGEILSKKYSTQSTWLNDPANRQFYAIGELMDAMGLTRSDVGSVLSTLVAGGTNVPEAVKRISDALNKILGLNGQKDVLTESAEKLLQDGSQYSYGTPRAPHM